MAAELDKIFSGNKLCQLRTKTQRFGDRLCFHHHFPENGGGNGLRNVKLFSTTERLLAREDLSRCCAVEESDNCEVLSGKDVERSGRGRLQGTIAACSSIH